jgi:hypothetical protein
LEIKVKRTISIVGKRHPAADGEAVEDIPHLEARGVVQGDRPEGIGRRRVSFVQVQRVSVRSIKRLAGLVAEIEGIDRKKGSQHTLISLVVDALRHRAEPPHPNQSRRFDAKRPLPPLKEPSRSRVYLAPEGGLHQFFIFDLHKQRQNFHWYWGVNDRDVLFSK